MPDTFSMSFVIAALYYASTYLKPTGRWIHLFLYSLLLLIGVLAKLPSGYILILLVPMLVHEKPDKRKLIAFGTLSVLTLLPVFWWYFIWVPHLVATYEFWHFFMGKSIVTGASEILEHLSLTLSRFYDSALKYIGFALFVLGLFVAFYRREKKLLIILGSTFVAFGVIMLKAGFTFAHHSYYVLPFVPVMALVAGNFIAKIKRPAVQIFIVLLVAIECIGNSIHDFRIPERHQSTYALEHELDQLGDRKKLIFINSDDFPTPMYFAHRKGWIGSNAQIKDQSFRDSLNNLGLKQIVILNEGFGKGVVLDLPTLYKTEGFTIYSSH